MRSREDTKILQICERTHSQVWKCPSLKERREKGRDISTVVKIKQILAD